MANGIELIVEMAGCSNRCKHCYGSGMPYRPMPLTQYIAILTAFKKACDRNGIKFYPYPMHDVSTHPQVAEVVQVTVENSAEGISAFQPFVTPGNSLATRKDLQTVLHKLEKLDIKAFWLTIHGRDDDHDWATSREHSYQRTSQIVSRLSSLGYSVGANYLITKRNAQYFPAHAAELRQMGLSQIACEIAGYGFSLILAKEYYPALPDYADILPVKDAIVTESAFHKDKWRDLSSMTEGHYLSDLEKYEVQEWEALEKRAATRGLALVCDRNLNVHIGVAGTYFDLLGNVMDTPTETIIENALRKGVSCIEKYFFEQHSDLQIHELARLHGHENGTMLYWTYEGLRMRWLELDLAERKTAHS